MATDELIRARRGDRRAERAEQLLDARPASAALYERAVRRCRSGVASSFQAGDPYPIYVDHGSGQPGVGRRRQRVRRLPRRLRLQWSSATRTRRSSRRSTAPRAPAPTSPRRPRSRSRSPRSSAAASGSSRCGSRNSGTEATMDAIRVARAATGPRRRRQDRGLVPRPPRHGDVLGGAERRRHGRPRARADADADVDRASPPTWPSTRASCRSTTLAALERCSPSAATTIACLILEPVMMNIGIVEPEPGYLEARARALHPSRRRAHLRRGEVRGDDRGRAAPPSATACSPTSRASPRRSCGGTPARRSAARPTSWT